MAASGWRRVLSGGAQGERLACTKGMAVTFVSLTAEGPMTLVATTESGRGSATD